MNERSTEHEFPHHHFETASGSIYDLQVIETRNEQVVATLFRARRKLGYKAIEQFKVAFPGVSPPKIGESFQAHILTDNVGDEARLCTSVVKSLDTDSNM